MSESANNSNVQVSHVGHVGKDHNLVAMTNNRKLAIPDMDTLFKVNRNPLQDDPRNEEMLKQTFETSLMSAKHFNKIKDIAEFTALFYPFVDNLERYVNLDRIMQYFFILDDHEECLWGDGARTADGSSSIWTQLKSALDLIEDSTAHVAVRPVWWKPYVAGNYLAIKEVCREFNPQQRRRQVQVYRDYAEYNMKEAKIFQDGRRIKDLNELFEVRIQSGGGRIVLQQIEYAYGIRLTDEEYDNPLMTQYMENGALCIALANDIMSYEKELKDSGGDTSRLMNCVSLVMHWNNCSYEESIAESVKIYNDLEQKTMALKKRLLAEPDNTEDVVKFIESIDQVIGGNFQGHFYINRYNNFN